MEPRRHEDESAKTATKITKNTKKFSFFLLRDLRVLRGFLIFVFSVAAAAQSPTPLRVPYRLFKLDNGLAVILHQDKSVPILSVNVWYHVGSGNEKPGRTGF